MEEICSKCSRSADEVRLLDAISDSEMVKICEECAILEEIPVIRKPSSSQLEKSDRKYNVNQRLRRMAGLTKEELRREYDEVTLNSLRKTKDYKTILEERFKTAKERNKPLNLVENYNWVILMARKNKKLSRNQLAEAVGEPEIVIKMIENNELPDDASRIIKKIEQYLGVHINRDEVKSEEINLIEESAEEVESHPSLIIEEQKEDEEKLKKVEEKIINEKPKFDAEAVKNITIADLVKLKKEREERRKCNACLEKEEEDRGKNDEDIDVEFLEE
ncbi:helix-turn-helix transcriptional regulator [Candidatus Pacearchaeota archaeon]|nr:helix-turn-helix transcriptional regulator [Candidatus Pacearchaeota archaeon]